MQIDVTAPIRVESLSQLLGALTQAKDLGPGVFEIDCNAMQDFRSSRLPHVLVALRELEAAGSAVQLVRCHFSSSDPTRRGDHRESERAVEPGPIGAPRSGVGREHVPSDEDALDRCKGEVE